MAVGALSLGLFGASIPVGLAAAVTLAVLAAVTALCRRPSVTAICCLFVAAGYVAGTARLTAIDRSSLRAFSGRQVTVTGYLASQPRRMGFARSARLRVTGLRLESAAGGSGSGEQRLAENVLIRASTGSKWPASTVGDQLRVSGEFQPPRNGANSDFDWIGYLRLQGVHMELHAVRIVATGRRRGGPQGFVDGVRRRAETGLGVGLPRELAALARGMVLGEDAAIPARVRTDFKRSGLYHLLAVSGSNVVLLAIFVSALLALAGLGVRARLVGVLAAILLYVPLTGAGPSIMRAGAMGAAATVAALAGRLALRWYVLLFALAFTLAVNPRAWQDIGWQLSFAAVVAIFVLAGPLRRALARWPNALAEAAAMTLAATLGTAPLMAYHFGYFSIVSLIANLAAAPLVAPIMWLGSCAAMVAQFAAPLARVVNLLNAVFLGSLAQVAAWAAAVPGAVLTIRLDHGWQLVAAYGLLALAVTAVAILKPVGRLRAFGPRRAAPTAVAALCALVAAAVTFAPDGTARGALPPGTVRVTFFDIGQGDATLIQTPEGGSVLVDGGPPGDDLGGKLSAAGVESLDLIVTTHAQLDHYGGLAAAVDDRNVRAVLDGDAAGPAPAQYRQLITKLNGQHAQMLRLVAGQQVAIGRLVLHILWPAAEAVSGASKIDPNRRAFVLLASYADFDLFLPADAESDVTAELDLPDVEAIKVAHHGSADPGLPGLLERLAPEYAAVEVGAGNRYGHPSPETMRSLQATVPHVFRTDRDGTVVLEAATGDPGDGQVTIHARSHD